MTRNNNLNAPARPVSELTMNRILKWILLNGALLTCVVLAFRGIKGAQNIVLFYSWIVLPLQILWQTISSPKLDKLREKARKDGRSVPAWMSVGADLASIGFMLWMGWFATPVIWLVGVIAEAHFYDNTETE